jgi:O-antigen/teichoic acid export membrane protein
VALGDERHNAIAAAMGAVANVVINLFAIPAYGMVGAAAATIAAELVVFAYVYYRLLRVLGPLPLDYDRVARGTGATLLMVAVLAPLGDLTVLVRVVIGVAVFVSACAALRVVTPDELRGVLRPRAT